MASLLIIKGNFSMADGRWKMEDVRRSDSAISHHTSSII